MQGVDLPAIFSNHNSSHIVVIDFESSNFPELSCLVIISLFLPALFVAAIVNLQTCFAKKYTLLNR